MFGIGGGELFIILLFGFLIFGPDKLPEIAKTVGKGIARFREAQQEVNDTIGGEKIFDPSNPDEPFKNPVEVLDKLAQKQEEKRAAKASSGAVKPASELAEKPVGESTEKAGADKSAEPSDAPRQESFTERKARYERERAARKAAEAAEPAEPADFESADEESFAAGDQTSVPAPAAEGGDE